MTPISIGDMAQSFVLRRHQVQAKAQLDNLIEELASGKAADISRHLSGSYAFLSDVDNKLGLLDAYDTGASEASLVTDGLQAALETVRKISVDLGAAASTVDATNLAPPFETVAARATEDFGSIVAALNTEVAGRHLLSGTATDQPPLLDAATLLDTLRAELGGVTDAAGARAALDAWFGPGGDFETVAYLGDTSTPAAFLVGDGETVSLALRADSDPIRDLLKNTAMAALSSETSLTLSTADRREMLVTAGQNLSLNSDGLTRVQSDLGYAQARIE